MTISHVLWLGSEESFHSYRALEHKFFGAEPIAFSREDEPEFNETFGVRSDRIGLGLLERVAGQTVLKVHGSISQRHSWWHSMFPGQVTSYEAIEDALDIVARDEDKTPVLMDFATGGGVARGADKASRKIRWARQMVKINAHTDSTAFSAGYWLASAAGEISASRMAEVGSIGTLMITYDMTGAAEKEGIKYHVFRAGEYKALGLPYEEMTDKVANHLQEGLEKTNQFFLDQVSSSRGLPLGTKESWGEGKTFYAQEALEVGLIDRVATLDEILGSGASHSITSDNRRMEMKISAEKLAQISGGADPKDVLTEDELKQYQASLEEEGNREETAEDQTPEEQASEGEGEGEGDEGGQEGVQASVELLDLTKTVGRLEAKLEVAEESAKDLQEKLDAKDSDISALAEVAKVAVGNLCTALGKPKEIPSSTAGIVSMFNDLQGEMARRFQVGQQSSQAPTQEGAESKLHNFRHNV